MNLVDRVHVLSLLLRLYIAANSRELPLSSSQLRSPPKLANLAKRGIGSRKWEQPTPVSAGSKIVPLAIDGFYLMNLAHSYCTAVDVRGRRRGDLVDEIRTRTAKAC